MCPQLGRYVSYLCSKAKAGKNIYIYIYDSKPRPAVLYVCTSTIHTYEYMYVPYVIGTFLNPVRLLCMICSPNRQIRTNGSPKISGILEAEFDRMRWLGCLVPGFPTYVSFFFHIVQELIERRLDFVALYCWQVKSDT